MRCILLLLFFVGTRAFCLAQSIDTSAKTIHVFVALCDNKYQGIVPVPAKIGNGQDPDQNLYWGCGYGIRTYFKKSSEWKLLRSVKTPGKQVMERVIFKHKNANYYLIADAYNGMYIKQCTIDLLNACAGNRNDTVHTDGKVLGIAGNAKLVAYIGHDGLMDFSLPETFNNKSGTSKDAVILACISKKYFAPHLRQTLARPLIWTTGLMCPEAYTLHDALSGYIKNETADAIRNRAAAAYSKYLHCSIRAARGLLVSGY